MPGPPGGSPRSASTLRTPESMSASRIAGQLVGGVAHAGEVCHRQHRGLAGDPFGDRDGAVARRTAGAVGHRDERRPQRLELADRAPQHLLAGLVLGREELERERPAALPKQVADAHALPPGSRHGAEDTGLRSPDDRAARRMGRRVGPERFRDDIESTLQDVRAHAGRLARPARSRRAAPGRARPHQHLAAASASGPRSAGGATTPSPSRDAAERRRSRCCAPARRWSCCTPAPWSTTTTWTPPTYAAAGRPPTARSSSSTASTAGRPNAGAVRRLRRDPARRPPAQLVRRAAAHLRPARRAGARGARLLRPHPQRGRRRPVPRRLGAGARRGRRGHGDDGAALQVGEVLHRAAAAHRGRPGRSQRRA